MDLIRFQGLNCYHECVLSIANHFGVDYPASFASLWAEKDFRYDPHREAYLTKRMISNLEILGAKAESFDCFSKEDKDRNLAMFNKNEFFIIGMDAFYVPWNQFFQTFHGSHYFIAQNADAEILPCIDPTYDKKDERITRSDVEEHIFDVCRVTETDKNAVLTSVTEDAEEILLTHQDTRKLLLSQIYDCINIEREKIVLLAKYIDAMINNRYLYWSYLKGEDYLLFDDDYFLGWKAVKNGLYKAAVSVNQRIIDDICGHFNHLIDIEIVIAERIIDTGVRSGAKP